MPFDKPVQIRAGVFHARLQCEGRQIDVDVMPSSVGRFSAGRLESVVLRSARGMEIAFHMTDRGCVHYSRQFETVTGLFPQPARVATTDS
jgi:hypothetical protein